MSRPESDTLSTTCVTRKHRPAAVIYTHSLLEGSMTFVKSHAEALRRYNPVYAGAHRVDGIPLPDDRTYVLNNGTPLGIVREAVFRKWGWAPGLVRKLRLHTPQVVHTHFGTAGKCMRQYWCALAWNFSQQWSC